MKEKKKIDYELLFYLIFTALLFCIITGVAKLGIIPTILIIFVISVYMYITKIISLIIYRLLRNIYKKYILPVLSDIKQVKRQIEEEDTDKPIKEKKQKKLDSR